MSMNRPSSSCRNFVFKWRGSQARISDSAIRRVLAGLAGHAVANPPTAVARKQKVSQSFQTDLPRPVLREKRIPFARNPNQSYKSRHPGPQEGRIAIVTNVGPGCGGRDSARRVMGRAGRVFRERCQRARRMALLRTAKPCGPGTRCWCQAGEGLQSSTGRCEPPIRRRWRQDEFVSRESTA